MAIGTIKKRVLVSSAHPPFADASPTEGYGIILGEDGQEVFFLDSVVNAGAFCDLKQGQRVRYTIEKGPLRRATSVVPCCEDQLQSVPDQQAATEENSHLSDEAATKS